MVIVPQFGRDKYILPLHQPFSNSTLDPLTSFLLILIVVRSVEQPVSGPNGLEMFHVSVGAAKNPRDRGLTLYTVSAQLSFGTFQSPKPTSGIS